MMVLIVDWRDKTIDVVTEEQALNAALTLVARGNADGVTFFRLPNEKDMDYRKFNKLGIWDIMGYARRETSDYGRR